MLATVCLQNFVSIATSKDKIFKTEYTDDLSWKYSTHSTKIEKKKKKKTNHQNKQTKSVLMEIISRNKKKTLI